jgi:TonB family protein
MFRVSRILIIAALIGSDLGLADASAAPDNPVSNAAMSQAQADKAIMAYYPPEARAEGIEGVADLKCGLSDRARLENCSVIAERPASHGFGEAALTLSKLSQDNLDVLPKARPNGQEVEFAFSLRPPRISPNTLLPTHFRTIQAWTRRPTASEFAAAYPPRAKAHGVDGRATIHCLVAPDGGLTACTVVSEAPANYDFGAAALSLSKFFHLKPPILDGEVESGIQIVVPMGWRAG